MATIVARLIIIPVETLRMTISTPSFIL